MACLGPPYRFFEKKILANNSSSTYLIWNEFTVSAEHKHVKIANQRPGTVFLQSNEPCWPPNQKIGKNG